jgi:DNA-binding transcriptional regulator YiaG
MYIHYWDHCNIRRDKHAGQFYYQFSKPLNLLELNSAYPKEPKTLGDYIRKWRMDKGISQVVLAKKLRVNEMTVVNWEVRGIVPAKRHLKKLRRAVPNIAAIA